MWSNIWSEYAGSRGISPQATTAASVLPSTDVVQLRYATLPSFLRPIAVHYWFAAFDARARQWHRWEVWQTKDAGGLNIGHVHCDRRHPDCDVGGGAYRVAAEWNGSTAQTIRSVLNQVQDYPHREHYRAWPGPNSNTFVAWVLRQAGLHHSLDPRAVGKDYLGPFGIGLCFGLADVQVETPVLGVKCSRHDGVEVHVLGLTCGLGWWPPQVSTPLGRVRLGGVVRRIAPACPSLGAASTPWRAG